MVGNTGAGRKGKRYGIDEGISQLVARVATKAGFWEAEWLQFGDEPLERAEMAVSTEFQAHLPLTTRCLSACRGALPDGHPGPNWVATVKNRSW